MRGFLLFLGVLAVATCWVGCNGARTPSGPDGSLVDVVYGPGGAAGFCCPISPEFCDCVPQGGWSPVGSECPRRCDVGGDGQLLTDEYGCRYYVSANSCRAPPFDAGTPIDAGNASIDCGDQTCAPSEYCFEYCSGVDAAVPSPECRRLPSDDLECSSADPCGCLCAEPATICREVYDPQSRVIQCGCA